MELDVQRFLRTGRTLGDLLALYAVKSRRHTKYPELVSLKYDQINSPMDKRIVQECRGIILNSDDNWNVVARPFDKFFNLGEGLAANIDWKTAKYLEKLDGFLMQLYWYKGKWQVASSGSPDASGEVNGTGISFAEMFWNTFSRMGLKKPHNQHNLNFLFELTGRANRVVVQHTSDSLTLIGVRDTQGQEYPVSDFKGIYPVVKEFPIGNIEEALATLTNMPPLEQEGYVVVDAAFNRVKVKCPAYVALRHMRDGMSLRRVLDVVRRGEIAEVLAAFPEWTEQFQDVKTRLDFFVSEIHTVYETIKDIQGQKAFALEAVKTRCPGALFNLRKGRITNVSEHVLDMQIDSLALTLGLKESKISPNGDE